MPRLDALKAEVAEKRYSEYRQVILLEYVRINRARQNFKDSVMCCADESCVRTLCERVAPRKFGLITGDQETHGSVFKIMFSKNKIIGGKASGS